MSKDVVLRVIGVKEGAYYAVYVRIGGRKKFFEVSAYSKETFEELLDKIEEQLNKNIKRSLKTYGKIDIPVNIDFDAIYSMTLMSYEEGKKYPSFMPLAL